MPIVTAHCRIIDGMGNPECNPQVFLKIDGHFYRTPIHLKSVYKCEGGWTGSITHYRAEIIDYDKEELKLIAKNMLNQVDLKKFALDGTGLKHCGIRFIF